MSHLAVAVSRPPSPTFSWCRFTPALGEAEVGDLSSSQDWRRFPSGKVWVTDRREAWYLTTFAGLSQRDVQVVRELYRSAGVRLGEAPDETEARARWLASRVLELVRAGKVRKAE